MHCAIASRVIAAHTVRQVPHGDEKRAAVAIVIVGSEAGTDSSDPVSFTPEEMSVVPGDITGFDGSVVGVAGGAAFLLCRPPRR